MNNISSWSKGCPMRKWNLIEDEIFEPSINMAVEEFIAMEVGRGFLPPVLRLWKNKRKCFVLGPSYVRKIHFNSRMKENFKRKEIDIVKRFSGGEAIFQDSTCLNFSLIVPGSSRSGFTNIKDAFETLSSGVMIALSRIGIHCQQSKVEGSFCPGPYDIAVDSRKLAGVSLAWRSNFLLVHGTLLVNTNIDEYFKMTKKIYLSSPEKIKKERITSLAKEKRKKINFHELCHNIIEGYSNLFQIDFIRRKLSQKEKYLAEKLRIKYKL